MTPLVRPAIAWLLAFLMPLQALTVVYLDVRGPAHFHVPAHAAPDVIESAFAPDPRHEHSRRHEYSHVVRSMGLEGFSRAHVHQHTHGHGVERHRHRSGDTSVVTIGGYGLAGELASSERATSGRSGVMFVALPAAGASPHVPALLDSPEPRTEPPLEGRPSLGRLDRPPRILPI